MALTLCCTIFRNYYIILWMLFKVQLFQLYMLMATAEKCASVELTKQTETTVEAKINQFFATTSHDADFPHTTSKSVGRDGENVLLYA